MNHNPIIIALDVESADQARGLVALGRSVDFYKVGMELYAAAGMDIVDELIDGGKQVFLDFKFHDIGETVKRAVAQVAKQRSSISDHSRREIVMRAAVEGKEGAGCHLLGVTVLTDTRSRRSATAWASPARWKSWSFDGAQTRSRIGVDGLVCSPLESPGQAIAGPGKCWLLRAFDRRERQPATRTRCHAWQAIADGADYLVIGRQVTRSADPKAEVSAHPG